MDLIDRLHFNLQSVVFHEEGHEGLLQFFSVEDLLLVDRELTLCHCYHLEIPC